MPIVVGALSALAALAATTSPAAPPRTDTVYTDPPLPRSVHVPRPGPLVVHARPLVRLSSLANDDYYPAGAIRRREQGRVAFALAIDVYGRVTSCTITASTGSAVLDDWSCRLVRSRARYVPARDARGN